MQTFALTDLPKIAILAFLELLLSADNAVVLGLISHSLPPPLRRKALFIGVISSFFFRAVALIGAAYLLHYHWVQLLGAAYLLYLSIAHFVKKRKKDGFTPLSTPSFWKTVFLIEFFDLAFAIDSIIAGIAFIEPSSAPIPDKLWIVYVGGMLGLLGIRYAASLFSQLLDRFPRLETSAYLLIGWIALQLSVNAFHLSIPYLTPIFWSGIIVLFLLGFKK